MYQWSHNVAVGSVVIYFKDSLDGEKKTSSECFPCVNFAYKSSQQCPYHMRLICSQHKSTTPPPVLNIRSELITGTFERFCRLPFPLWSLTSMFAFLDPNLTTPIALPRPCIRHALCAARLLDRSAQMCAYSPPGVMTFGLLNSRITLILTLLMET